MFNNNVYLKTLNIYFNTHLIKRFKLLLQKPIGTTFFSPYTHRLHNFLACRYTVSKGQGYIGTLAVT